MKLMVVGGAGFVGSHLVDRLVAERHTVDVVDDLSTGSLGNLAAARSMGGELKIHNVDVCAPDFTSLVAHREPELVYQLALLPPGRDDVRTTGRALHGMLNVVDAARAHGVGKVVTCLPAVAMYGDVAGRDLPVKEGRAWAPIGERGVLAVAAADLLRVARERDGIEFTALAASSVYGPRQRADGGVVAAFAAAHAAERPATLFGDGRQARDFLFVDDLVDALVRAGTRGSGLVVNVGTGTLTSLRDLWAMIAGPDAPVANGPARPGDVARFSVSPTRARIHLAWAPWTDLPTGLRSLR